MPEVPVADWRVDFVGAVAWPVTALLVALLVVFSEQAKRQLSRLVRRVKRFSAFGVEFELAEGEAGRIREATEESLRRMRREIQSAFDRQVSLHNIPYHLQQVVGAVAAVSPNAGQGVMTTLRATIHVPDILFSDALYQLVDYYPTGGGSGRAFSIRRGIIGKAWRFGISQYAPAIPPTAEELILHWGMTHDEASAAGLGRQAFLAVVLRHGGAAIGIFYLDSTRARAFGGDDAIAQLDAAVSATAEQIRLTESLAEISAEMNKLGPRIRLYEVEG